MSRSTAQCLDQLTRLLSAAHIICDGEVDQMVAVFVGGLVRVARISGAYDEILKVAINGLQDAREKAAEYLTPLPKVPS